MTEADQAKRAVGFAAVDAFVRSSTCVGLGTGSTARWAVARVGERIAAGEQIVAVPTSEATARQCRELGIPLVGLGERAIDVAIDGADEVAPDWSLTKGGGGAHLREKAVALAAGRFIVVVTPEKLVDQLGAFPTPVEVVPFTVAVVAQAIEAAHPGVAVRRRGGDDAPFVTDNGNAILDCGFGAIGDAAALDASLRGIHGVVATGLFAPSLVANVLAGYPGAVKYLERRTAGR
ncbi:MAG TPA: ribose-5-phosphate isomerase RpiA [Candidatus Elarobacter sp.]|jgi:ribose 5-phosphate isomerase A